MNHKGNSLNHSSDSCLVMRYIGNCLVSLVWKLKWARVPVLGYVKEESYLVDPASSHMLVSKIKPCMYKRSTRALPVATMIHDNSTDRTALVPATHHSNFCPINFRWTLLAPYEKSKFLGSGGSMVARLKLKGIDGRAPPGIIAIVGLKRGIPSKRESSARVDYVPALCTHRPSLLPIEWSGEVLGSWRRGRFAAGDVARIPLNLII
ncbi:hypothetical protein E3N88_19942 [Mikania micrantha]|uniref:Uncharacterized protein n=1 Tax=Mikania micrantha TaxID=192012 RepID=A0A5N6NFM3_9ASTR|nr:hypothetical protein E3N88_19942 [Mikania micrantha]